MSKVSRDPLLLKDTNDTKRWTCSECSQTFLQSKLLEIHAIETDHKAYRCTKAKGCGRTFVLRTSWARHERSHSAQKAHACSRCGKRFHRKDNCDDHERTCGRVTRRARVRPKRPPTPSGPCVTRILAPAETRATMLDDKTLSRKAEAGHRILRTLDIANVFPGTIESQPLAETDWGEWPQTSQSEDTTSFVVIDSPHLAPQMFGSQGSVIEDSGFHLGSESIPWPFQDSMLRASYSQAQYIQPRDFQPVYSACCIAPSSPRSRPVYTTSRILPSSPQPRPAPWTPGVIACGLLILGMTFLLLRPQCRSTLSISCLAFLYFVVCPLTAVVYLIELSKTTS
jgi:DNA-directed RNA polymerase subunit RPC12/RpoP